ncbi:uncharacterized protein LOC141903615 [Tubulanus polymorphus]|uniref:uncharacterized protein LOC141903615 n=1 Tax=Tubulanus polymorphus TaxID=672921 RepID=UPI003DA216BE
MTTVEEKCHLGALYYAVQSGDVELVGHLMHRGVDVTKKLRLNEPNALWCAVERNLPDVVSQLLVMNDNARHFGLCGAEGSKYLEKAVRHRSKKMVLTLLEYSVNTSVGVNFHPEPSKTTLTEEAEILDISYKRGVPLKVGESFQHVLSRQKFELVDKVLQWGMPLDFTEKRMRILLSSLCKRNILAGVDKLFSLQCLQSCFTESVLADALQTSLIYGCKGPVQYLTNKGAIHDSISEFHLAAFFGDIEILEEELNSGVTIDKIPDNTTLIHFAVMGGQIDFIRKLSSMGCSMDALILRPYANPCEYTSDSQIHGRTPLHIAAKYLDINLAIKLIPFLVGLGADINRLGECGETPLQLAVYRGEERLMDAILAAGADITAGGGIQLPEVFLKVQEVKPRFLEKLINLGVPVNEVMSKSVTALMQCCAEKNVDCLRVLLHHGADVTFELNRQYQRSALACACFSRYTYRPAADNISFQIQEKQIKVLKTLFDYMGLSSDLFVMQLRRDALGMACRSYALRLLRFLLDTLPRLIVADWVRNDLLGALEDILPKSSHIYETARILDLIIESLAFIDIEDDKVSISDRYSAFICAVLYSYKDNPFLICYLTQSLCGVMTTVPPELIYEYVVNEDSGHIAVLKRCGYNIQTTVVDCVAAIRNVNILSRADAVFFERDPFLKEMASLLQNPVSLMDQSRVVIRRCLSHRTVNIRQAVRRLPIPKTMQDLLVCNIH